MKIGFFGTPEISAYALEHLLQEFEIAFVVTGMDKPVGRKQRIKFNPVKEVALKNELNLLQPDTLNDENLVKKLASYDADIFVVVAYGKKIPRVIFDLPAYKTINLHPSLLPKYRGAAPVQWALINGEQESGVTIQQITEKMDAGDLVLQEKIELSADLTAEDLYQKVLPLGAEMLSKAIKGLAAGKLALLPQNEADVTVCRKINRETAAIDWHKEAETIHNLIRGLNPAPVAWTTFRAKNCKIWQSTVFTEEEFQLQPGELFVYKKKRLLCGTGKGLLEILSLQPENKKQLKAVDFINGSRLNNDFFV